MTRYAGVDLAAMSVNDVIRAWPHTVAVFSALGIDACCGGSLAVGEAARRHGHDVAAVLASLESELERERKEQG